MKKSLLVSALFIGVAASTPAFADIEMSNQCDVNLEGHLKYDHGNLTVTMDNGDEMLITPDHSLHFNGEEVALNSEQQQWVDDYYKQIEIAIPMTVEIATEGLEVASYAVTEAFGALLGNDDELVGEFNTFFSTLSDELNHNFYAADGSYAFDSSNFNESDWIGGAWENEFEERVEELVSKSMGKIMVSIGTEMMLNGGNMEEFEAKMESFGDDIETKVEGRTAALEQKADDLCGVLAKADYAENRLSKSMDILSGLNIIDVDNYNYKK